VVINGFTAGGYNVGTTLYVSPGFTKKLVGLEEGEDGEKLLAKLQAQAGAPEYTCRFRWEEGSVAFYDNRACQHCAVLAPSRHSGPCIRVRGLQS
jgi:alpha-ketoglutarate-dependent taurine dioxygenase